MPQKVWNTGDEVLAADFNQYLQNQVCPVFTSTAQRDSQWATPPIGAVCVTTDTATLWQRVGSQWIKPFQRWSGGVSTRTTPAGPQGAEATTGVAITITCPSGRNVRLEVSVKGVNMDTAGSVGFLRVKEGATIIMECQYPCVPTLGGPGGTFAKTIQPAAGSHTYTLFIQGVSGLCTAQADANTPITLEAFDVGGTVSPVRIAGFEWRDIGQPGGGTYDYRHNPKLVWHTWEGYSWAGAEAAFASYPPHVAVNPRDRRRCQYVDLDRHVFALAGTDTEDSWVCQIEVAGYAGETHDWPAAELEWLGRAVLAPIQAAIASVTTIPPVLAPAGFHGEGEGIILASPSSPIRFPSVGAWDAFAGHVGHQHAPAPDSHWDPGRLNVAAIIAAAGGAPDLQPKDENMPYFLFAPDRGADGRWWFTNLRADSRPCDSLADTLNVDWFLRIKAGVDGLVCNRAADGSVAGPIAVDAGWLEQVTSHAAAEP